MAILATMEITPEEFVDMYADLEIIELCRKHDKMDELIDYIYDMYRHRRWRNRLCFRERYRRTQSRI